MSGWGWAAAIFIGWMVVSFVTAPLVGRWLRRNSAYYPRTDSFGPPPAGRDHSAGGWTPPAGPCVPEPDPPHRPSTH